MSSSMLEQAVIDAQALKEAAVKNAEQEVLEKYAGEIKEAVKNKKAIAVLENLRKHLAVDSALEKDSIKEAVADGKNQINEATTKLESALKEKSVVEEELICLYSRLGIIAFQNAITGIVIIRCKFTN